MTCSIEEGGLRLKKRIDSCREVPFCAGKLGTSEFDALLHYIMKQQYPSHVLTNMFLNAGLFGENANETIDQWCAYMLDNIRFLDEAVLWNPRFERQEKVFYRTYVSHLRQLIPLRSLEPFYQKNEAERWTLALTDIPFCVVSPFWKSIPIGFSLRDKLFPFPLWSEGVDFRGVVRSGYSPTLCSSDRKGQGKGGWSPTILAGGWFTAVKSIVDECVLRGARFVFVGAGCLSLPICFELKKRGISSIHTGGGTQIIFGIKGKRWLQHSVISTFFGNEWLTPDIEEVPGSSESVEGGCYW